jgi:hypothetical protein
MAKGEFCWIPLRTSVDKPKSILEIGETENYMERVIGVWLWWCRAATVSLSDTVLTATKQMKEQRMNSVIITSVSNKPVGILTSVHSSCFLVLCSHVLSSSFIRWNKLVFDTVLIELCGCSSKDVLMRVVAQGLSPATTNVDKVYCASIVLNLRYVLD